VLGESAQDASKEGLVLEASTQKQEGSKTILI
jgi:hypothetical protein